MIADARQYVYQSPWNLLLPALAIFLTVFVVQPVRGRPAPYARRAARPRSALSSLAARDLMSARELDGNSCRCPRDCHLTLAHGRVLGLVGKSGAGKSMVGRTIAQAASARFCGHGREPAVRRRDLHSRCRRHDGALCSAARSHSFRRNRSPRSTRCSLSANRSTNIWRRLGLVVRRATGDARSPC